MDVLELPRAGVSKGWRKTVADRIAPKVAAKTSLREEQARALVGAAFIGLSTYYVLGSIIRFRRKESASA